MKPNAFIEKPKQPGAAELKKALGSSKVLWDQLKAELADEHDVTKEEWKSYSLKSGWSLRLIRKKRVIVYLLPCDEEFSVAFALGDRAVQAARDSKLPKRVMTIIDQARRYAEGTHVRTVVKTSADVKAVKKLAAIKISH